MLHDVQLPEPRMVERVAGRVYNVTQAILLREHQHCVQKALHGIDGTNESRPVSRLPCQVITTGRGLEHLQLVRLVDDASAPLLSEDGLRFDRGLHRRGVNRDRRGPLRLHLRPKMGRVVLHSLTQT